MERLNMSFSKESQQYFNEFEKLKSKLELIQDDFVWNKAAYGINKLIIAQGKSGLSVKQKNVYDKYIVPIVEDRFDDCFVCGNFIDKEEWGIESIKINKYESIYFCEGCFEHSKKTKGCF